MTGMVDIRVGDSLAVLRTLPDKSVHCIITSPPYWGLRDYGVVGQIGLEASVDEHMRVLVELFRECRRVLRDDGTLWVNYGDAYAGSPNGRSAKDTKALGNDDRTFRDKPMSTVGGVLKPKDRMMLPARLAIALQADGWWLRDEIVWSKPNPMPSSVRDRTTPAHEMIYMFSKKPRYYYDQVAIKEPLAEASVGRLAQNIAAQAGSLRAHAGARGDDRPMKAMAPAKYKSLDVVAAMPSTVRPVDGFNDRWDDGGREALGGLRNKRSVWTISPKGFKDAHFATFPPDLIRPCILAGTPEKCCPECGSPWKRSVESRFIRQGDVSAEKGVRGADGQKPLDASNDWQGFPRGTTEVVTTGWSPTCSCGLHASVPGTVLDPFFGAGTTGLVAARLDRNCIGIELNPEYAAMARRRIDNDVPEKPKKARKARPAPANDNQASLFEVAS